MTPSNFSADIAREYLKYDAESGLITWKFDYWGHKAGVVAGCLHWQTGYWRIGLLGRKYPAHRLAWLLHHGEWPNLVDHINGDKLDNRMVNLRSVDAVTNNQNRRSAVAGSASGLIGAHWHKSSGLWKSTIRVDGKKIHIGLFLSENEAHSAYLQAKRLLHAGNTL